MDFLESMEKLDAYQSLDNDLLAAWKMYLGEANLGWLSLSDEI
jgi:hypothetical protein